MKGYSHLKWQLTWWMLWCLSAGKKSTSSFMFFIEILQRYCELVIWANWASLATHTQIDTIKNWYYIASSNDSWSSSETIDSFISFIKWYLNFRYCTCFKQGVPWHSGRLQTHPETHMWHENNIQSISFPTFFWRYCKDMQTSYFGYFRHAWLHTPKMILSTCRKPRCLSACQNYTSSFTFLEILHFKKSCNLIGWQ